MDSMGANVLQVARRSVGELGLQEVWHTDWTRKEQTKTDLLGLTNNKKQLGNQVTLLWPNYPIAF